MKRLLLIIGVWLACVLPSVAANPSFQVFFGTNGIVIRTNGNVVQVDGMGITNGNSPVFITTNLFVVNNTYTSNLFATNIFVEQFYVSNIFTTNIFVDQSITTSNFFATNIVVENISITTNLTVQEIITTNIFVNQTIVVSNVYVTNLIANTIISKDILWTNDNGTVRLIDDAMIGLGTNAGDAMFILERNTNAANFINALTNGVPVFTINSNGNIAVIKGVAYEWPVANTLGALTNNGSGVLGWDANVGSGGGGSGITNLFTPSLSNATIKPLVVGVGTAAGATNTIGHIRGLEAGSSITLTENGSNVVIAASVIGTTNFINLSVQAAKIGPTNYPAFNNGYDAWETSYYETNAEGSRAVLYANWQFMVPHDYATNSLQLLINYSLINTNGPNTSNVIFGASVLVGRSGTTNNIRTNLFGFTAWGTNDWIAKYDGTNYLTNLVINLGTNSALKSGDLSVLKVQRDAINDTYGGVVSIHGLQLMYTRQ